MHVAHQRCFGWDWRAIQIECLLCARNAQICFDPFHESARCEWAFRAAPCVFVFDTNHDWLTRNQSPNTCAQLEHKRTASEEFSPQTRNSTCVYIIGGVWGSRSEVTLLREGLSLRLDRGRLFTCGVSPPVTLIEGLEIRGKDQLTKNQHQHHDNRELDDKSQVKVQVKLRVQFKTQVRVQVQDLKYKI